MFHYAASQGYQYAPFLRLFLPTYRPLPMLPSITLRQNQHVTLSYTSLVYHI